MNENIQVQEILLVDMPIQLMATTVVYYCHSDMKTLELNSRNFRVVYYCHSNVKTLELNSRNFKRIKFLMFSFLGYLSGIFLRNFHYRVHGQLGKKHYLRAGISRKKTPMIMFT